MVPCGRTDPRTSRRRATDDASANPAANKDAEEAGGHQIAIEDEQPDPQVDSEPAQGGDTLQFENAETSLDQPSEG